MERGLAAERLQQLRSHGTALNSSAHQHGRFEAEALRYFQLVGERAGLTIELVQNEPLLSSRHQFGDPMDTSDFIGDSHNRSPSGNGIEAYRLVFGNLCGSGRDFEFVIRTNPKLCLLSIHSGVERSEVEALVDAVNASEISLAKFVVEIRKIFCRLTG